MMLRKLSLAFTVLFGLSSVGCQTPYSGCSGGCCGGSCGADSSTNAAYVSPQQTYAPTQQQALPPAFNSGGSGSR